MSTLDKILEVDKALDILRKDRNLLLDAYAKEICPYHVGQVVEVKSYSHKGKMCRISVVYCTTNTVYHKGETSTEYMWRVHGVPLKNDGTDSLNECRWDASHEEERI